MWFYYFLSNESFHMLISCARSFNGKRFSLYLVWVVYNFFSIFMLTPETLRDVPSLESTTPRNTNLIEIQSYYLTERSCIYFLYISRRENVNLCSEMMQQSWEVLIKDLGGWRRMSQSDVVSSGSGITPCRTPYYRQDQTQTFTNFSKHLLLYHQTN